MNTSTKTKPNIIKISTLVGCLALLSACQSIYSWQAGAGPTRGQLAKNPNLIHATPTQNSLTTSSTMIQTAPSEEPTNYGLAVIEIDTRVIGQLKSFQTPNRFSTVFANAKGLSNTISSGDVVDVTIWEAPPALLFGTASDLHGFTGSKEVKLPEQMVDSRGQISVPFVGKLNVVGKTPDQVQSMIIAGLDKKANKPSVIVRIVKNNSADITIIGEVNNSTRMPLTGKGERVLDAIAAAGGAKQPAERVNVQLTRGHQSVEMLLSDIINDAWQNIRLQQGDVLSVKYKTNSYMVMGATAKNDEIDFEANGISLMQALARAGGLNDNRADAQGVFIFRYENPQMLSPNQLENVPAQFRYTKIPVVYRLNLKDPMNYLVAREFMVQDQDVIYVSNAPAVEFNKFLSMISQSIFSITNIRDVVR